MHLLQNKQHDINTKNIISWFIEHKIFYCYKDKNLINIDVHLQIHLIYKNE